MKHAICSDIHGRLDSFEVFLRYIAQRDDISCVIIPGDFFGVPGLETVKAEDVLKEMDRQYKAIGAQLISFQNSTGKGVMLIAGNYDYDFSNSAYLKEWDMHRKTKKIDNLLFAGFGGHDHKPYKVLEETAMSFDEKEAFYFLESVKPDVVISHSRVKEYLRQYSPLLSINGHTHIFEYFYNESDNKNRTIVIKPGSIGSALHSEKKVDLAQTFMVIDYSDLTQAGLYTLERNAIIPEIKKVQTR